MAQDPSRPKNPKRVAAGKLNVLKRRGLTPEGLERLRAAALAGKPWLRSTGPRTAEGKAKSATNGKATQKGEKSVRERRAELAEFMGLAREMAATRNRLTGLSSGQGRDG